MQDTERWEAVKTRDADAADRFVYAVTTTGVYCRSDCRSRQPKRDNVQFFDTAAEARRAGFRACKRCRPDEPRQIAHREAILRACRRLQNGEAAPSLAELAQDADLSPHHFLRVFRQSVGLTPASFARAHRAGRLREELAKNKSVAGAIFAAGFGSLSRAYAGNSAKLGMTPGKARQHGAGMLIRHALAETWLGWLLVAATDRGVCMTALGDDPDVLSAELKKRFARATIVADETRLASWMKIIVAQLERPAGGIDLPLDIAGTVFQRRVWDALNRVPLGQTATYAQIARRIGQPTAVRAVARACATNDVAIVIPCHRIVGGDGKMHGYRWGIERKQKLLDREASAAGKGNRENLNGDQSKYNGATGGSGGHRPRRARGAGAATGRA